MTNNLLAFAAAADAMVFAGTADPASATDTLERLLAKVPDNPEFRLELAVSLANSKLYDRAASQLALAVVGLNSKGDKKAVGESLRANPASALNDDVLRRRESSSCNTYWPVNNPTMNLIL